MCRWCLGVWRGAGADNPRTAVSADAARPTSHEAWSPRLPRHHQPVAGGASCQRTRWAHRHSHTVSSHAVYECSFAVLFGMSLLVVKLYLSGTIAVFTHQRVPYRRSGSFSSLAIYNYLLTYLTMVSGYGGHIYWFYLNVFGFNMVLAYPGSPWKRAIKWMCVCMYDFNTAFNMVYCEWFAILFVFWFCFTHWVMYVQSSGALSSP